MSNGAPTARGCWLGIILLGAAFVVGAVVAVLGYVALFRALSLYWE